MKAPFLSPRKKRRKGGILLAVCKSREAGPTCIMARKTFENKIVLTAERSNYSRRSVMTKIFFDRPAYSQGFPLYGPDFALCFQLSIKIIHV